MTQAELNPAAAAFVPPAAVAAEPVVDATTDEVTTTTAEPELGASASALSHPTGITIEFLAAC